MAQEPEAIPESTQEEFSKKAWEEKQARNEALRDQALVATIEIEASSAASYRTKKQLRAARKRLEDAL